MWGIWSAIPSMDGSFRAWLSEVEVKRKLVLANRDNFTLDRI
jgi:hypothetical protein